MMDGWWMDDGWVNRRIIDDDNGLWITDTDD